MKIPLNESLILVFDPNCPLCVRFTQALARVKIERPLACIPLTEDALYEAIPALNRENTARSLHLVVDKNTILEGGDALEFLASSIPACEPFLWLLGKNQGRRAIDYFYSKARELREKTKQSCSSC
jgi:predicted DCC family thiol-disulfide oxidoreductase YuxK